MSAEPLLLPTARDGLVLRELRAGDAETYYALLQASAAHLTRLGDFTAITAASAAEVTAELFTAPPVALRFAVIEDARMVGRVDLVPVDPPRYGLGYWLAPSATGRGVVTAAVATLLGYARQVLGASDVYAGVTHTNTASAAVLDRLGFARVADLNLRSRYHLHLGPS